MKAKMIALTRVLLASALFITTLVLGSSAALAKDDQPDHGSAAGAVYVLTNAAAGNAVAVFQRAGNGRLTPAGTVATGGLGTGAGTGSQGALVLSENGKWLYAVNPGSDDFSVFAVRPDGIEKVNQLPSGGDQPISLTINHRLLYVLNAGPGGSNITGFVVGPRGILAPLPGSTRPLNSASGPAQVSFSPDGRVLVVTEKATNMIDTFTVGRDGLPVGPVAHPAAGVTPFGFAFAGDDTLVVSEAFGGAANGSAASSYNLDRTGTLTTITASAPTHQTAACWTAVSPNGRYAYTMNAGSGSVSGYRVGRNGSLTLLDPSGISGQTGADSHPTDAAFSENGRYFYVLSAGTHGITAFQVQNDGSLTAISGATGLPTEAVGLVAR
jgi:6-phosphogluconolactonase (cycloisomerase 2 family)